MDPGVLEAMRRWPNVPAVYGWLSLTPRGEWRLHPMGDAMQGGYGEGISNTQILSFINRNYVSDQEGTWFFQNGPQRVFVRIDAAPLILRLDANAGQIVTHHGQVIQQVRHWWIDEIGRLFAQTDAGPGMVDDRDLMLIGDVLLSDKGVSLIDWLEQAEPVHDAGTDTVDRSPSLAVARMATNITDPSGVFAALMDPAPLDRVNALQVPACLGFVANPAPPPPHQANQALE